MPAITSLQNPLVKAACALRDRRRERRERGLAVLEGIRVAEEAVAAGLTVTHYFYTEALMARERGRALVAALERQGVRGYAVSDAVMAKLAGTVTPQGLVAVFRIPVRTLDDLPPGPGPVLVTDGLQDPGNLGTLIRSAEALGGAGVVVPDGSTDPWSPKVVRAAAGSLFRLPVVQGGEGPQVLAALRERGFRVAVTDPDAGVPVWELDWRGGPWALVIGGEGAGLSATVRRAAAATVRIPMPGPTESLNAAVAAAICLYEALRTSAGAL